MGPKECWGPYGSIQGPYGGGRPTKWGSGGEAPSKWALGPYWALLGPIGLSSATMRPIGTYWALLAFSLAVHWPYWAWKLTYLLGLHQDTEVVQLERADTAAVFISLIILILHPCTLKKQPIG